MEYKALIARINELAALAKTRALTEDELAERKRLREEYMTAFRASFRAQLDNTYVEQDDGERVPVREYNERMRPL